MLVAVVSEWCAARCVVPVVIRGAGMVHCLLHIASHISQSFVPYATTLHQKLHVALSQSVRRAASHRMRHAAWCIARCLARCIARCLARCQDDLRGWWTRLDALAHGADGGTPVAAALQPYLAEVLGENTAGILGVLSLHESRRADLDAVADDGQEPAARGTLGGTGLVWHWAALGWYPPREVRSVARAAGRCTVDSAPCCCRWTCAGGVVARVRACSATRSTADWLLKHMT